MRMLLLIAACVMLLVLGVFVQIWLWRNALMPVCPILKEPTFWQMFGIDLLFGAMCGAASHTGK